MTRAAITAELSMIDLELARLNLSREELTQLLNDADSGQVTAKQMARYPVKSVSQAADDMWLGRDTGANSAGCQCDSCRRWNVEAAASDLQRQADERDARIKAEASR